MEVGPWRVDGQGGLKTVQGGWEEYTHMVYGAYNSCLSEKNPTDSVFIQWTNLPVLASHIPARIILSIHYLRPPSSLFNFLVHGIRSFQSI